MNSPDIVWQRASVTRSRREERNGHRGAVVWFTGLSGSGKSTLAHRIEERLHLAGCRTFVLDGDNVRHGLCADLDFSDAARTENIRRVGETAKLFVEAGVIVLTAFISPFQTDRARVRELLAEGDYLEVFCDCPLATCEERDVKGLYRRARAGQIAHFTGISSPYQAPPDADLILETGVAGIDEGVDQVLALLHRRGIIGPTAMA